MKRFINQDLVSRSFRCKELDLPCCLISAARPEKDMAHLEKALANVTGRRYLAAESDLALDLLLTVDAATHLHSLWILCAFVIAHRRMQHAGTNLATQLTGLLLPEVLQRLRQNFLVTLMFLFAAPCIEVRELGIHCGLVHAIVVFRSLAP